ncbi:hypothetical protein G6011_08651 [Alternaria panax]|uniref:FAD dependent oxidoreductase domain-containing protein n=1 Tax=Alternaria panax TaxID=48097 RepID=A0AAD4FKD1_9PLEO|nr:hypothetical protein G6011_08651 [Alternaria panax]
MGHSDPEESRMGGASGVTLPETSAVLNVEEYASQSQSHGRTGFSKQGGQSLSWWLQQVRCDPLLDHRTTNGLPYEADTIIIGSGITGTLVAKHHLETFPNKSVVVLEAREFCSGATGRNAGHCKPDQWRHYKKFAQAYGQDQAIKVMENEQATWRALVAYVKENNVECDLWVGETLDVPLDNEVAKIAREVFEGYAKAGGKVEHIEAIHDPARAAHKSRIKSARACYAWQASTLQPWKLTAHIMRENISKGANLQTRTVAKSVSEATGSRKWVVQTERGDIACDTIVHATNAYSAALEPSLRGVITPKPHMCNRVVPPQAFSGSKAIQNSYGVLLPDELDAWVEHNPENCINDGIANLESVTKHVKNFAEAEFEGWTDAPAGPGEGFEYSWSGIIGLSADGVLFVGELPGKPGQYICAGHHGHGMARIFTAAPGLLKLMNGEDWSTTGLPEVYQMTPERLERLTGMKPAPAIAVV